jgi:predicted Ser/Thr protein kinase
MQDASSLYRSRIAPGTRLNGIYEVEQIIAVGGMGEVYKGHTIQTGDTVAIKVMLPELAENAAAMSLFRKEASALHYLQHDAIVRYYVFTIEPVLQRPYLAMEFVEGKPLSDILKQGPLTFEAVQTLRQRIAAGLQAAHERGIVHRDVSPDNVIITGGDVGRSKIIDFGIARSSLGREGTVIGSGFAGKFNYVSPEQLGLFGGDVGAKSDIYSLGLLLVEAMTGQPLDMGGSQVDIIEKRRKVPELGGIDLRIRPLIEKMLQPAPENRPDSMAEVAAWQPGASHSYGGRFESGSPRAARPAPAVPARRDRLARRLAITTALSLLVMGGAGAAYYYSAYYAVLSTAPVAQQTPAWDANGPTLSPAGSKPAKTATAERPAAPPASSGAPITAPPANPAPTLVPTTSPPADTVPARPVPAMAQPPALKGSSASASTVPPQAATPPPSASPLTPLPQPSATANPVPPAPSLTPAQQMVAALPPQKTPAESPVARIHEITRYIDDYDGGKCVHIMPMSVTAHTASIEGYGAQVAPFVALNDAFKKAMGFEPDIGVRQVTAPECPALTFLGELRGNRTLAPRITIEDTNLKSGQTLVGVVDNYGNRHVELLIVSDEGTVQNVTRLLKSSPEGKSFNLRLERTGASGPQPQLLVAVASAQPLDALNARSEVQASQFFPQVLIEAARTGLKLGATAKYFKLDR